MGACVFLVPGSDDSNCCLICSKHNCEESAEKLANILLLFSGNSKTVGEYRACADKKGARCFLVPGADAGIIVGEPGARGDPGEPGVNGINGIPGTPGAKGEPGMMWNKWVRF